MTNLLRETLESIEGSGHSPEDVVYIGNLREGDEHWSCTWDQFARIADADYDASYGAQKVASDLWIVFSDGGRLERGEYDGSEWWEWIRVVNPPSEPGHEITRVIGEYWPSLSDLHNPEDAHHAP